MHDSAGDFLAYAEQQYLGAAYTFYYYTFEVAGSLLTTRSEKLQNESFPTVGLPKNEGI